MGVEDPSNPYVAETASGAAFGLAEGTTPAGPDAYAEPVRRRHSSSGAGRMGCYAARAA